jgi:hypothetical protein
MYEWFLWNLFLLLVPPRVGAGFLLLFPHSTELQACSKTKAIWDMSGGVGRLRWLLLVARRYQ